MKYAGILVGLLSLGAMGLLLWYAVGSVDALPANVATNIAAPANGTARLLNMTFQAQQYIGFYGNISLIVMREGGDFGQSIYNYSVRNGSIYLTKTGSVLSWPGEPAPTDEDADRNLSLTGEYITKQNFLYNVTALCGVAFSTTNGLATINTTDNFTVGLFRNQSDGEPSYFFCSRVRAWIVSQNGFGVNNYQIIAPKTSTWQAYDFYYEGGWS